MDERRNVNIEEKKNFNRGRNYLIHLLAVRDYTVKEIYEKFRKSDYPDDVIDEVVQYGLERHYLDDLRYAEDFIRCKKGTKSIRQLKYQLLQKGIASSILDNIVEEDDSENLRSLIIRYRERKSGSNYEKDAKTYQYFVRKGYNSSLIKEILRDFSHK